MRPLSAGLKNVSDEEDLDGLLYLKIVDYKGLRPREFSTGAEKAA